MSRNWFSCEEFDKFRCRLLGIFGKKGTFYYTHITFCKDLYMCFHTGCASRTKRFHTEMMALVVSFSFEGEFLNYLIIST